MLPFLESLHFLAFYCQAGMSIFLTPSKWVIINSIVWPPNFSCHHILFYRYHYYYYYSWFYAFFSPLTVETVNLSTCRDKAMCPGCCIPVLSILWGAFWWTTTVCPWEHFLSGRLTHDQHWFIQCNIKGRSQWVVETLQQSPGHAMWRRTQESGWWVQAQSSLSKWPHVPHFGWLTENWWR